MQFKKTVIMGAIFLFIQNGHLQSEALSGFSFETSQEGNKGFLWYLVEPKIISSLENLLKKDERDLMESSQQGITAYKEWKIEVEKNMRENQGLSQKINEKIAALEKKLTRVEDIRNLKK